jgi:hypothetical protein
MSDSRRDEIERIEARQEYRMAESVAGCLGCLATILTCSVPFWLFPSLDKSLPFWLSVVAFVAVSFFWAALFWNLFKPR